MQSLTPRRTRSSLNLVGTPTKKRPTSPPRRSATLGASSADLDALDLARDRAHVLHVPPMRFLQPGKKTLETLTILARTPAPGILKTEDGVYFGLSEQLEHGTYGNIMLGVKSDGVMPTLWVFKQMAADYSVRAKSFIDLTATPPNQKRLSLPAFTKLDKQRSKTPFIAQGTEESLENEVNFAHLANSALAPHAVLRTEDRAYLMLPLADTDLQKVWMDMGRWPTEKRRPVVLVIARQLIEELCNLHKAVAGHRDIKPSNIFLTRDGSTHIGDFGMALPFAHADAKVGTLPFLAPEVIYNPNHDKVKSDIFSIGAVLTVLLLNTGFFWEDLWRKTDFVERIRLGQATQEDNTRYANVILSYNKAFNCRTPLEAKKLGTRAKGMYNLFTELRVAYPALNRLLRTMQHPDPEMRPTASQALSVLQTGALAPTPNEFSELRALIGAGARPMRAAADRLASSLEGKVKDYIATSSRPRRASMDSARPLSASLRSLELTK